MYLSNKFHLKILNQIFKQDKYPQATQSLKVLADLPLQVVIFYQAYQSKIEEDVSKLIHIMINSTLTLHPEHAIK